ncbi:HAD family hydrolase [Chlamydia vaughanii]|uniref:HAD family hydrolase n=1 Tax=Chlamydia vaughanii TaxID=3112552 RepID=UPI0032B1F37A
MNLNDYQVFFFDLDGLILDTEPVYYRAFLQACREHSYDNVDLDFDTYYYLAMLGRDAFKEKIIELFPNTEPFFPECYYERERIYQELMRTEVPALLPGVEDFIKFVAAENKVMGVVTNSARVVTDRYCRIIPVLGLMQFWVTREDYDLPKPAPDSYRCAYEKFARNGEKVVGFEDSVKGLRALAEIPSTLVVVNSLLTISQEDHESFAGKEFHYFSSFNELMAHSGVQNQL